MYPADNPERPRALARCDNIAGSLVVREFTGGEDPLDPSTDTGDPITVAGVIIDIEPDLPFGVEFNVDDGSGPVSIFVHASTGIDLSKIPFIGEGKRVRVTGFSSFFEDEPELQPRFRGDLQPDRP